MNNYKGRTSDPVTHSMLDQIEDRLTTEEHADIKRKTDEIINTMHFATLENKLLATHAFKLGLLAGRVTYGDSPRPEKFYTGSSDDIPF